jgi:hypothetical protein
MRRFFPRGRRPIGATGHAAAMRRTCQLRQAVRAGAPRRPRLSLRRRPRGALQPRRLRRAAAHSLPQRHRRRLRPTTTTLPARGCRLRRAPPPPRRGERRCRRAAPGCRLSPPCRGLTHLAASQTRRKLSAVRVSATRRLLPLGGRRAWSAWRASQGSPGSRTPRGGLLRPQRASLRQLWERTRRLATSRWIWARRATRRRRSGRGRR